MNSASLSVGYPQGADARPDTLTTCLQRIAKKLEELKSDRRLDHIADRLGGPEAPQGALPPSHSPDGAVTPEVSIFMARAIENALSDYAIRKGETIGRIERILG